MWKIVLVIFLFLILAGLFIYQNYFVGSETDQNNASSPLKIGSNAIFISDQRPGSFVTINLVFLEKPGYVIIYNDNRGRPGEIIGSTKLLVKGESGDVVANLVRPSVHGEEFFAVIHEETGDGIFSPNLDTPLRDSDGNIIFMRFSIDRGASEASDINL